MSRSPSLALRCLPQRPEQDGPDPCRDLRNLTGFAINRQRRGGSGSPPAAAPAAGTRLGGRGTLPAGGGSGCALGTAAGAAGNQRRVGRGVCAAGGRQGYPRPHCSRSSAERSCGRIALLPCLHGQGPFFLCFHSSLGGGCGLLALAPGRTPTSREAPPRPAPFLPRARRLQGAHGRGVLYQFI